MSTRHRGIVRKRTTWLFLVFALLYVGIVGRLVWVQVYRGHQYQKWAREIRHREMPIEASRGCIYDRNGRALAISIESASIFAQPRLVKNPTMTAARLAPLIGEDAGSIEKKLRSRKKFVWLVRKIDARVGDEIRKLSTEFPGIGRERDTKRVYPAGSLAAQIIGFTNIDNKGVEGLECVKNNVLMGRDGSMRAELDGERRVIPETRHIIREPENGKDIYLTIDTNIQHIAERAISRMAEKYHPQSACAVVMDPHTGEILALANYPFFDPNNIRSTKGAPWRNRAVADLYEPGSTLKVVTVAAALNEDISQYEVVAHCSGREKIKGGRISCTLHHPFMNGHGGVDMYRLIQQSCNIAAAHLAFRMGSEKLLDYEKAFGLVDKADAGFGCEAVGSMIPAKDWRLIRLANIGFGQGIAVTPLQMTCVYSTIANGGVYTQPKILREMKNADGSVFEAFKIGTQRRVVSKKAAFTTAKMLTSCVQVGTGKKAKINGRTVAGKTGSAQVAKPRGGYEPGVFIASFMGFSPSYKPKLAIAVVVNRPQGSHWGAAVAAPVFQEIGEKALWYLKVPSDAPTDKDIKQKQNGDRKRIVKNLQVWGSGT